MQLTCFVRARYFQFVHYIIIDQEGEREKCNFMQLKDDYWNLITKVAFRQQMSENGLDVRSVGRRLSSEFYCYCARNKQRFKHEL